METLDLRRVIDLHFQRNVWQLCCDRGTVSSPSLRSCVPSIDKVRLQQVGNGQARMMLTCRSSSTVIMMSFHDYS